MVLGDLLPIFPHTSRDSRLLPRAQEKQADVRCRDALGVVASGRQSVEKHRQGRRNGRVRAFCHGTAARLPLGCFRTRWLRVFICMVGHVFEEKSVRWAGID